MRPTKNPDGISEARRLYDFLCELPHGTTVTYDDFDKALGRDCRKQRGPILRAAAMLERDAKRTLVCERGVGYRIAHPSEHADLAVGRARKSRRVLNQAARVAAAADRSQLNGAENARLDQMTVLLGGMQQKQKDFAADLRALREDAKADRRSNSTQFAAVQQELTGHQEQLAGLRAQHEAEIAELRAMVTARQGENAAVFSAGEQPHQTPETPAVAKPTVPWLPTVPTGQ
jgi:hypothetical protein